MSLQSSSKLVQNEKSRQEIQTFGNPKNAMLYVSLVDGPEFSLIIRL